MQESAKVFLTDLADYIDRNEGIVTYGYGCCLIGWNARRLGDASHLVGSQNNIKASLGHYAAELACFEWPHNLREWSADRLDQSNGESGFINVRPVILRNLRHWASIGRVEWID